MAEIDFKDLYIRGKADYENMIKRITKEKGDIVKQTEYKMLMKILPLYHDAKRGLAYNEKGALLIYNKFVKFLKENNVGVIDSNFFKTNLNNEFTEEYAVAIATQSPQEGDLFPETLSKLDNKIYKVVEDGFYDITNNKVISYAKVIVYKI